MIASSSYEPNYQLLLSSNPCDQMGRIELPDTFHPIKEILVDISTWQPTLMHCSPATYTTCSRCQELRPTATDNRRTVIYATLVGGVKSNEYTVTLGRGAEGYYRRFAPNRFGRV